MQKLHNYEIIFLHQALLQTGNPKKSHHQEQHELLLKVGPAAERSTKKLTNHNIFLSEYQSKHYITGKRIQIPTVWMTNWKIQT